MFNSSPFKIKGRLVASRTKGVATSSAPKTSQVRASGQPFSSLARLLPIYLKITTRMSTASGAQSR